MLQVRDIVVCNDNEIIVKFPYASKTRDAGFEYYVPFVLVPSYKRYLDQLPENRDVTSRFLKNWNNRSKKRHQNTGEKAIKRWIEKIGEVLKKDIEGYTTHTFRRSAATALADNGETMTNLKRHGRWTSESCVEGYIDNSKKIKADRLRLLGATLSENLSKYGKRSAASEGKALKSEEKGEKVAKTEEGASISAHAGTVVYHNCNMYSSGQTMNFGMSAAPPTPPPATVQSPTLLKVLYDNMMKTFKKNDEESISKVKDLVLHNDDEEKE